VLPDHLERDAAMANYATHTGCYSIAGPRAIWHEPRGAIPHLPDVFSETFMAVLKSIGAFERHDGKAKFRAWLKMITVNKANDHFRRQGKQPRALGGTTAMMTVGRVEDQNTPGGDGDSDESLAESEQAFIVQRTLQLVRKEFRKKTWLAFQRTAIDGQNATQVAEEIGMTPLAVRKAKSRVMRRLKETLGEFVN